MSFKLENIVRFGIASPGAREMAPRLRVLIKSKKTWIWFPACLW